MKASAGRPKGLDGELLERTKHGVIVNQRIRAIVGQVIDELEKRRAAGRGDFVAKLADEVEEGGLAAWKALQELLPRDADVAGKVPTPTMNLSALFVQAARDLSEMGKRNHEAAISPMASLIELTANAGSAPDAEPAALAKPLDAEIEW